MDVVIKTPTLKDGVAIWRMVKASNKLDVNSTYLYCLLSDHFAQTCAIAYHQYQPVAFVTAYRLPQRPNVLFVWQIAVEQAYRGQGIALQLLEFLSRQAWFSTISEVQATISPSNDASAALFKKFAQQHQSRIIIEPYLTTQQLTDAHEEEPLWRVLMGDR